MRVHAHIPRILSVLLVGALVFGVFTPSEKVAASGSQTYSTPGTYSFVVPSYGTLTVEVWGGGGGGGGAQQNVVNTGGTGGTGGTSSWDGAVLSATGGTGGEGNNFTHPGTGGTGSGGTTNLSGANGSVYAGSSGGAGGNGANGGAGASAPCCNAAGHAGTAPGGGGSGSYQSNKFGTFRGDGGGGGGYATKTFTSGYTPGSTVTIVVGSGGSGGYSYTFYGGAGAPGQVVVSWTDPTVPAAPTSVNATAGTNSIGLTWAAPSNNGGSAITNYKIYRSTASPASTLLTTVGNVTSYTDSTALINTRYYYRVTAVNTVGEGAYSNEDNDLINCAVGGVGGNVTGWAWSDTIGWISLNASDTGTCTNTNYGLTIAADGTMSGYMWNENVGWVSANAADLTGCPTAPCTARMNQYAMQGWMKVLSANDAQSGGWDGFISLSGSGYGPTLATSGGLISGYAWGDMNTGWVSFGAASAPITTTWTPQCANIYSCSDSTHRVNSCTGATPVACAAGLICSGGACVTPPAPSAAIGGDLKATPQLIRPGGTTVISWNIQNATTCSVTEDNTAINDSWTGVTGSKTTSAISAQTIYTLSCTGAGGTLTQTTTVTQNPNWKEL